MLVAHDVFSSRMLARPVAVDFSRADFELLPPTGFVYFG
jgi:hypothetical protein